MPAAASPPTGSPLQYSPALRRVTTGFGMGPGGATALWATSPPDRWDGCVRIGSVDDWGGGSSRGGTRRCWVVVWGDGRMETVLGHEHDSAPVDYSPSTCRLATRSSSGGLTRVIDGDTRLAEGFPLRCFQRFARPNVATQRCRLPDNWITSGSSSPVLSY